MFIYFILYDIYFSVGFAKKTVVNLRKKLEKNKIITVSINENQCQLIKRFTLNP